jgi:hypothetical protein
VSSEEEDVFGAIFTDARATQDTKPDPRARKEEQELVAARNGVRKEIHSLVLWALRLGGFLLAALITIRFWHLGAPESLRWLSDTDTQSIDKMLFSSAFGGLVLNYLRSVIEPGSNGPV